MFHILKDLVLAGGWCALYGYMIYLHNHYKDDYVCTTLLARHTHRHTHHHHHPELSPIAHLFILLYQHFRLSECMFMCSFM
jgi:hypothetical protein